MVVDTGIFIEHLRAKKKDATTFFRYFGEFSLFASAVTIYELHMGANSEEKRNDVEIITGDITVLPFSNDVASKAAEIYHDLKRKNKLIEFRDIFIAATCIVYDMPILTLNKKHFQRIEGLRIQN